VVTSPSLRLGFIGLGLMGTAMTLRLLECGASVTVWNLEPDRISGVAEHGAVPADTPAAVAAASDIVLICVLDTNAVSNVIFGPGGIIETARPGQIVVDHSTTDPEQSISFAAELERRTRARWVDAPCSGGPLGARRGGLTVMAGGNAADIETITPVMSELAAHFTHVGKVGAGQVAKTVNQAIVCANYVLMAEALALAEAGELDAARLPQCLAGGHADGEMLRQLFPQMQARAFEPPRSLARQILKDLRAVSKFAQARGLVLPMVEMAARQYQAHVDAGAGLADSTTIIRLYKNKEASP
jgi:3-hydroxyisobutyrate dehydrogenase